MLIKYCLISIFLKVAVEGITPKLIPDTGTPPIARSFVGLTLGTSESKLYVFSGFDISYKDDFWEFDLKTRRWREIFHTSSVKPLPRQGSTIFSLESDRKILLYGGFTKYGPVSDLWLFDIDQQSVRYIQWKAVDDAGTRPHRCKHFTSTFYTYKGRRYLAVMEMRGEGTADNPLYILDIENFTWSKYPSKGTSPPISGNSSIVHKDGKLYVLNEGEDFKLYAYDIESGYWDLLELQVSYGYKPESEVIRVYPDFILLVDYLGSINVIPIEGGSDSLPDGGYSHIVEDRYLYIFGGYDGDKEYNSIWRIDLSSDNPRWINISRDMNTPVARSGHAMEVYNEELYILGGVDKYGFKLLDIWKFNLKNEDWSPYHTISNIAPSPRSEFAYSRNGEILVIFGGKTEIGTSGELYTLNFRAKEWKYIEPKSSVVPSPRSGSCMGIVEGLIFIFGGFTDSGYSNELWLFDPGSNTYTLINPLGENPTPSAYGNCRAHVDLHGDIIFETYLGETTNQGNSSSIYRYNHTEKSWKSVIAHGPSGALVSALYIGNQLLIAGGNWHRYFSANSVYLFDVSTNISKPVAELPNNTFNGASVFYKNKLYIHGGGGSYDYMALFDITTNDLIVVELDDECQEDNMLCISTCSKGTYFIDGKCVECPEGSYSDEIGSTHCKLCDIGHYSDTRGADSKSFCKPCPYGKFNTSTGQSQCLDCPYDSSCSLSVEKKLEEEYPIQLFNSIQPNLYESSDDTVSEYSNYFNIIFFIISSIVTLFLLSFKKTRKLISILDMYQFNHNYELDKELIKRRTLLGGLFTIIFMIVGTSILFRSLLSLAMDNIKETKALVPLISLEEKYENVIYIQFIAQDIQFSVTFEDYRGDCVTEENVCVDELGLYYNHIEGKISHKVCEWQELDCVVTVEFSDFVLKTTGSIGFQLNETYSYASAIKLKVSSSSSIPDEYSTIISYLNSSDTMYFRGSEASRFHLQMTPSLFLTDSGEWEKELMGYHVSEIQDPTQGSQIVYSEYFISRISFIHNLKAEIILTKSDSTLLTERMMKHTLISFFSALAGSILGILGGLGFIMNEIEGYFERKKGKVRLKRNHFKELTKSRKNLLRLNLAQEVEIRTQVIQPTVLDPSIQTSIIEESILENSCPTQRHFIFMTK